LRKRGPSNRELFVGHADRRDLQRTRACVRDADRFRGFLADHNGLEVHGTGGKRHRRKQLGRVACATCPEQRKSAEASRENYAAKGDGIGTKCEHERQNPLETLKYQGIWRRNVLATCPADRNGTGMFLSRPVPATSPWPFVQVGEECPEPFVLGMKERLRGDCTAGG
jgi:hypothetical protein